MHPNHTPTSTPMVPLDPKTGSTLEEKKPLEDGRQPPPSNPNNNPKHTLDNSDKVSNYTKQKRQKPSKVPLDVVEEGKFQGRKLTSIEMRGRWRIPNDKLHHRYVQRVARIRRELQRPFGHDSWLPESIKQYEFLRAAAFEDSVNECEKVDKYKPAIEEATARRLKLEINVDGATASKLVHLAAKHDVLSPTRCLTGPQKRRGRQRAFDFDGGLMHPDTLAQIKFKKRQLYSNAVAASTKRRYEANYKF